jgi:hypothetical protein
LYLNNYLYIGSAWIIKGGHMKEDKLLNQTLELLEEKGVKEAYDFILGHKKEIPEPTGQYYNFLYCLAALDGKTEEAMGYLEEAIIGKCYWYRSEVFDDEDLDSLREKSRFKELKDISIKRYQEALKTAETIVSWEKKTQNNILLALHGNQQNMSHSKEEWSSIAVDSLQVEYMQSKEIDSCEIFRWDDNGDGPGQLSQSLSRMQWNSYKKRVIGGFSAGCNVILRAILEEDIDCTGIILQSPWIPVVENNLGPLVKEIIGKDISVTIICGTRDLDCLEPSMLLSRELIRNGAAVKSIWVNELGHEFPDDFEELVREFLEVDN